MADLLYTLAYYDRDGFEGREREAEAEGERATREIIERVESAD